MCTLWHLAFFLRSCTLGHIVSVDGLEQPTMQMEESCAIGVIGNVRGSPDEISAPSPSPLSLSSLLSGFEGQMKQAGWLLGHSAATSHRQGPFQAGRFSRQAFTPSLQAVRLPGRFSSAAACTAPLNLRPSFSLLVRPSIHPSVCPSVYLLVCPSVCPSVPPCVRLRQSLY